MRNSVAGINETGINILIMDIKDSLEKINKHYYNIVDLVEKSSTYFDCSCNSNYKNYFNKLKNNYNTLKENILSYTDDLVAVKTKYSNAIEDIVIDLNRKEI